MSEKDLWKLGMQSIRELEAERGILASGRNEVYGCIFGRDSLITSLGLLRAYEKSKNPYFTGLVRKVLINLAQLQGTQTNIESGEEPGKIIHEYRPDKHEHLTTGPRAWYVYPTGEMRNYDTVDATPLFLMTVHAYMRATGDEQLAQELMPSIRAALNWLLHHADTNGDGFIDYWFHPKRTKGGLTTQSWMDSSESLFFEHSEERPAYPIAPVEVQAYTFVALMEWADYFNEKENVLSLELRSRAERLKELFNRRFVVNTSDKTTTLAFAIDGKGRALSSARSSMSHVLWAAYTNQFGKKVSILADARIPGLVSRLLSWDLFVQRAGVRTLSSRSRKFDAGSYHNGSIWPHDTSMLADGLDNFGYIHQAAGVRRALHRAYRYFKTPIELFAFTKRRFAEYETPTGGRACRTQAWSAVSLLSLGTPEDAHTV